MRTRLFHSVMAAALIFAQLSLQGCYGRFGLTTKLYKWNGTLGDKWINSIIMTAFAVLQVYTVTLVVDGVFLNALEFWSGKNPVAMGPQEEEVRLVSIGGHTFKITATRNAMTLISVEDPSKPVRLQFNPDEKAWYMDYEGEKRQIAKQENDDVLTLLYPDGRQAQITR